MNRVLWCLLILMLTGCSQSIGQRKDTEEAPTQGTITDAGKVSESGPGKISVPDALPTDTPKGKLGSRCNDDSQCDNRLCYGSVIDNSGTFGPTQCQPICLQASDYRHVCKNDSHCCNGKRCCVGCGEREGICID